MAYQPPYWVHALLWVPLILAMTLLPLRPAKGLLIGLRAVVPYGDLINAMREEKLLAVGAGDNVARLLPPLIIGEADVAEAVQRIDRACARIERAASKPGAAG